jgi:hypothetical protein
MEAISMVQRKFHKASEWARMRKLAEWARQRLAADRERTEPRPLRYIAEDANILARFEQAWVQETLEPAPTHRVDVFMENDPADPRIGPHWRNVGFYYSHEAAALAELADKDWRRKKRETRLETVQPLRRAA